MEALGIDSADIGLPGRRAARGRDGHAAGAGDRTRQVAHPPQLRGAHLAADIAADHRDLAEGRAADRGRPASSAPRPIRQYAEDWTLDRMLRLTEDAVSLAVKEGLPVMYVTEDTTRAHPDQLRQLYTSAIRAGADASVSATPSVTPRRTAPQRREVRARTWCAEVERRGQGRLARPSGSRVRRDQRAGPLEAGAHRAHGCGLGIGERVGNTAMDQLLVNLQLLGWIDRDLTRLPEYCAVVSEATGVPIPDNYPVVGRDAFRTGTGVHAAAIIKARKKGEDWLSDRVYSGVPAS